MLDSLPPVGAVVALDPAAFPESSRYVGRVVGFATFQRTDEDAPSTRVVVQPTLVAADPPLAFLVRGAPYHEVRLAHPDSLVLHDPLGAS